MVDVEGVVEFGIVDETFPADCGAWFFKIDPHDHEEIFFEAFGFCFEFCGVFESCFGVVNGARADNDHEAVVFMQEDVIGLRACGMHDGGGLLVDRKIVGENRRGDERVYA